MQSVDSVIHNFDSRLNELTGSYSALQSRIDDLDLQLHEKNKELVKSLRETERLQNLLNSILQSIDDSVIAVDNDGRICMVNNAVYDLLQAGPDSLHGRKYDEIFKKTNYNQSNNEIIEKKTTAVVCGEKKITTLSGSQRVVESTRTSLLSNHDKVVGMVEVLKDITEAKQLQQELKRKEIFSALTQMSSFFADEIRNPLAGIVGNLALLQERNQIDESDEIFVTIHECVNKLTELISDLHLLTRPVKPTFILTDFNEFITNVCIRFFKQTAQEVSYSIKVPKKVIRLNIDPILMQQVLINILQNAVDAIENGGQIHIVLKNETSRLKGKQSDLLLKIVDSGCGMSEKITQKLFTPFFTSKPKGRGLGLTMARNFIRFHDGDIKIQTKVGKGTEVSIFLKIT